MSPSEQNQFKERAEEEAQKKQAKSQRMQANMRSGGRKQTWKVLLLFQSHGIITWKRWGLAELLEFGKDLAYLGHSESNFSQGYLFIQGT